MHIKNTSKPAYSESWKELNKLNGIILYPFDILRPASSIVAINMMQNNNK